MRYLAFDFSKFVLNKAAIATPSQWQWITPFASDFGGRKIVVPKNLETRHRRWTKTRGNRHRPAHREIMLTLQGEAVYSINEKCFLRKPGTVVLLERHDARDLKGSQDKRSFSCLWLHLFSREYMTYYINSCDENGRYSHQLSMRNRTGNSVRLLMDAWDQCVSDEDPLCVVFLKSLIVSTLLEILGSADTSVLEDQQEHVVRSIQNYIRQHLAENLSLNSLANIAGYSPFFFHRLFLKHTGQTPVQFVNNERLAKAAELLGQQYTVQATAEAVGFSSVSYFYQFFKRHMQRSPGMWRERFKVRKGGTKPKKHLERKMDKNPED